MKRCQSTKRVLPKESPIVTRVLLRLPLGKSKNIAAKETHNRSRIEELDKRSGTSNEDQNHSRNEGEKGGDRPRIVAPRLIRVLLLLLQSGKVNPEIRGKGS